MGLFSIILLILSISVVTYFIKTGRLDGDKVKMLLIQYFVACGIGLNIYMIYTIVTSI